MKAKKFLLVQGGKQQRLKKIEILLLVLSLLASSFSTVVDTSAAFTGEVLEKPVTNIVFKSTYDRLMAEIQDEKANGSENQENENPANSGSNDGENKDPADNEDNNGENKEPSNNEDNNGEDKDPSDNENNNGEDKDPSDNENNNGEDKEPSDNEDNNGENKAPNDNDPESEDNENEDSEKAGIKGKWKTRNNKIFYYVNGKKVKGLKKIGTKYYYFDSKGVQRTGWQKYKESYYFFKISNGKKGFMAKSQKVNGIRLEKNGRAKLTNRSKAKMEVLIKANRIVEKATKPKMKKSEKLKKTFSYLLKHYRYRGSPIFIRTSHWERDYALQMYDEGHGSCYAYGAAFAFLANAVGYDNCYAVSSGGHGWAEVGGKVYDPSWCLVDKKHSYYALSYQLSGVAGRPNYKKARKYVVKI